MSASLNIYDAVNELERKASARISDELKCLFVDINELLKVFLKYPKQQNSFGNDQNCFDNDTGYKKTNETASNLEYHNYRTSNMDDADLYTDLLMLDDDRYVSDETPVYSSIKKENVDENDWRLRCIPDRLKDVQLSVNSEENIEPKELFKDNLNTTTTKTNINQTFKRNRKASEFAAKLRIYPCDICQYVTSFKHNYITHSHTAKHRKNLETNQAQNLSIENKNLDDNDGAKYVQLSANFETQGFKYKGSMSMDNLNTNSAKTNISQLPNTANGHASASAAKERIYQCDICQFVTRFKSNLTVHSHSAKHRKNLESKRTQNSSIKNGNMEEIDCFKDVQPSTNLEEEGFKCKEPTLNDNGKTSTETNINRSLNKTNGNAFKSTARGRVRQCHSCKFVTRVKTNFIKHLDTAKHRKNVKRAKALKIVRK